MSLRSSLTTSCRSAWVGLLRVDNHLIGLAICIFAVFDWLSVYDGIEPLSLYFSQGIYTIPTLNVLNSFFSAIYLTFAAIILLSLRQPLSRYETVLPNLIAVSAAFAVYFFVLVPGGNLIRANVVAALALIVAGALIVILALIYLRQAFSVTPQARFLVTCGPYSIIRHPMYVGNILSIGGVALLVDSLEAMILFAVCAGLQVARAFCEERLLRAKFPQYAEYEKRVGRFFPRLRLPRLGPAGACLALLFLVRPCAAAPFSLPAAEDAIRVAAQVNWDRRCSDWSKKATQGRLFTTKDQYELAAVDQEKVKAVPACKTFFELQANCQTIADQWSDDELNDKAFIEKIEATPGCTALQSDNVCAVLKKLASTGPRLADNRLAVMTDCLKVETANKRFERLRPGM